MSGGGVVYKDTVRSAVAIRSPKTLLQAAQVPRRGTGHGGARRGGGARGLGKVGGHATVRLAHTAAASSEVLQVASGGDRSRGRGAHRCRGGSRRLGGEGALVRRRGGSRGLRGGRLGVAGLSGGSDARLQDLSSEVSKVGGARVGGTERTGDAREVSARFHGAAPTHSTKVVESTGSRSISERTLVRFRGRSGCRVHGRLGRGRSRGVTGGLLEVEKKRGAVRT